MLFYYELYFDPHYNRRWESFIKLVMLTILQRKKKREFQQKESAACLLSLRNIEKVQIRVYRIIVHKLFSL